VAVFNNTLLSGIFSFVDMLWVI